MSTKEFIKKEVEKSVSSFSPEQFTDLFEGESSLIVLEIQRNDYVLTDIARIVEDNNAYITNLLMLPTSGGSTLLVSIKLNITDIAPVLRSFERFRYKIVYYFTKENSINDTYKERLEELLHYLEM
ncbi:MAG: hypothetical protein LBI15_09155 [Dysgonamonadaceae bacterium]|jgi:hypothetical protein|nr:hypothetical protein [Dysgonamonadaceae bacterium]